MACCSERDEGREGGRESSRVHADDIVRSRWLARARWRELAGRRLRDATGVGATITRAIVVDDSEEKKYLLRFI